MHAAPANPVLAQLQAQRATLLRWLNEAAFPLWASRGVDARSGGFLESIGQDGSPGDGPRRARVAPRQVFAFSRAARLGWNGDGAAIARRGIEDYIARFQRSDGLFIARVDADGQPLDLRANLYDQAFALLGLAAAAEASPQRGDFEHRALVLRSAIDRRLRAPDHGFFSTDRSPIFRESNPHMHLLEACSAWAGIGADPDWARWAADLARLGLSHFTRHESGAIGEYFTNAWVPAPGEWDRVEPGHQFEWAWLLLNCPGGQGGDFQAAALRLIDIGERTGVHDGVAVNALHGDLRVRDADARLWPQTERLKAAAAAARITGDQRHWSRAVSAAGALLGYLETPLPGLWYDRRSADGRYLAEPSPASSFYHLVCAISVLDAALGQTPD